MNFYNNDAKKNDGGALHLISFSQVFIEPKTHLDFVNNTGRYLLVCVMCTHVTSNRMIFNCRFGAAVVAKFDTISSLFEHSRFNPLCFFQYTDPSVPSSQWDNVCFSLYIGVYYNYGCL